MYDVNVVTSPLPTDCGPTCLKMLLDYYGVDVDLDTLIRECNTRLIGCTGLDLKRVGNAHGLDLQAWGTNDTDGSVDADGVLFVDRPAIIHWKFGHWCIYCGLDNGQAVIINPDRGKYHMSIGTFRSMYSGTFLTNGEPEEVPALPTPEERIAELEDELAAAKILLGVE